MERMPSCNLGAHHLRLSVGDERGQIQALSDACSSCDDLAATAVAHLKTALEIDAKASSQATIGSIALRALLIRSKT